jgi:starvation-inducible DNA-binding protein
LDEQSEQILAASDPMAERVRKTGGIALHSIGEISRLQSVKITTRILYRRTICY